MKTLRLLGLVSIAMVLVIGLSCKKDEAEPTPTNNNPTGGSSSALAKADINFIDENETFDFQCNGIYGDIDNIKIVNDTLQMIFSSNDLTQDEDTVVLQLIVYNINGYNEGDTYSVTGNTNFVAFSVYSNNAVELGYTSSNVGGIYATSGELKITSKTGNHIKGTFNFKGYTSPNPFNPSAPQKEVIVTNGKINCDYIVQ